MRRIAMRPIVVVLIAMVLPFAGSSAQTRSQGTDGERQRLMRSLETACTGFSDDRQWAEADACRRAWFADHEEAVWRLNLNPHPSPPQPPS